MFESFLQKLLKIIYFLLEQCILRIDVLNDDDNDNNDDIVKIPNLNFFPHSIIIILFFFDLIEFFLILYETFK